MTTRTLLKVPSGPNLKSGYLSWNEGHRTHQVELGEILQIGREHSNQIAPDDDFVSARHARIERRDTAFVVRDLRSRNGTFLNGTRVMEAILQDGDRIRIGSYDFRFSIQRLEESTQQTSLQSKNRHWKAQLERLPVIAESDFPILISGPSGSGKDLLAQNLHRLSRRSAGPFVGVNCSALSDALVESELFGHVRGSFTGATGDRKGAFEAARGGTLFLDEIGDLPAALQPKLLRALENNQIRPVGSDRSITTDVRIVAATHRCLKHLVLDGLFREDLYFRLHVIQIQSPALRDRLEDFDDLFYSFCRKMRVRFSYGAILKLKAHSWPGNVRELKNVISRAKAFHGEQEVNENDIDSLLDQIHQSKPNQPTTPERASVSRRPLIREIELEMIKTRLRANRGNQRRTAMDLNMAKSTLNDRIRAYEIDIDDLLSD